MSLGKVHPVTVAGVVTRDPARVHAMITAFDLERPGLAAVKDDIVHGRVTSACKHLLDYLAGQKPAILDSFHPAFDIRQDTSTPAEILDDTFTLNQIPSKVPRKAGGGLDWHHLGPRHDKEWGWALNRHGWLITLLDAWQDTG